jgi:ABC-type lipoprotein release transport system permease subunit
MLKIFLWLKYLRKKKMFFLSIAAVTLCSSLLIIVSNLFGGFIQAFEQAAVDTMGDIIISPPVKFEHFTVLADNLEHHNSVKAATGTLTGEGLLHLGKGNVKPVKFWGIDLDKKIKVTKFSDYMYFPQTHSAQTEPERVSGFIGIGVTGEPNELTDEYNTSEIKKKYIAKKVILTTGSVRRDSDSQLTAKRETLVFNIDNIIRTGIHQFDKKFIYLPRHQIQQMLYPDIKTECVDQVQIKLAKNINPQKAVIEIGQIWRNFAENVLGWNDYLINSTNIETSIQMQRSYIIEIRKQMGVLMVIFSAVSFSVVVLILCIFYMIVENRKKDIAVFKSFGTTGTTIAAVFIGYAAVLAFAGAAFGIISAWIVTKNINLIEKTLSNAMGLKIWKSSVYLFSRIPTIMDWKTSSIVFVSAIAAAMLGAVIPAIIAAKTKPVNILRYE